VALKRALLDMGFSAQMAKAIAAQVAHTAVRDGTRGRLQ
jgi:hypothetical protein